MAKAQILVVEDEGIVALNIESGLESLGYDVPVVVASGEGAIEEAERTRPDLVLMDIGLAGELDGVEAAEQIRERFNIPVIYLTAYADEDTLRRARITEPYGYLLKPFEERELHTAIEMALYKHKTEEALRRRDAILGAVSFAAEEFLKAVSWRENIQAVLERLGRVAEVSRIYIFENHAGKDGALLTSQRYEWTAPGIAPQIDNPKLQGFPLRTGGFARWVETLGQGQIIHGHVREFPVSEWQVLALWGIQSMLVVPIFVGGAWWGFIAFDQCLVERQWSAAEIDALRAAASTLGAAIQRAQLHNEIEQRATAMSILYEVATAGMTSIRLDKILNRTVAALQETLQADNIAILLVEPGTNELATRASRGFDPELKPARRSIGVSIPGWVVQAGQPVLLADARQDERYRAYDPDTVSELCVPLQVGQRIIGAVNLESHRPAAFSEDDLRLVSILAGHLAAVIENAYLFEETEHLKVFNEGIVQGVAEAVLLEDAEGILTFANPTAEELSGYTGEELIGLHWSVLVPEDEGEKVREERAKWPQGIVSRYETAVLSKEGQVIPVIVSARPLFEEGRFTGTLSALTDITQRKRAEEEREELIEELDAFAHTAAHDLKEPLASIVGYAMMLEEHWAKMPDEEKQECLQTIVQVGHKASRIVDELLLLAGVRKMEEVEMRPLNMASIVAKAQQRLALMIEEHQAEIILADTWPVALGYGPWVEEVWVNYLSNAIKYGGQPPRVELGATGQPDGTVRFWVRDNGPGLALVEQLRLFIPFARLNQARAKGHGLGLSIVRRIVERLGGQVGVESEVGQGSVFTFTLPAKA